MASATLLKPGDRLGGYEIEALVGRGGMGEVYRARQLSMDRLVALKVLSPKLARQDPVFAQRFVDEARAAGRLSHANIVGVHDVGRAPLRGDGEEVHFFSMELVVGRTIKDIIVEQGALDAATVAVVMAGMAEALVYAEAVGIVHRDIKPDNIMLTAAGAVKLADLGLAMTAGAESDLGKDGQGKPKVMGTPLYMSPEQARAQNLDHRSDQYSLGATLFHMLAGEPPFTGNDARTIMRAHCFEPVPDPREVRPDAPAGWSALCQRLMAKAADGRFASAIELRAAVQDCADGRTPRRRAAGTAQRPAWMLPAGIAAAVAIAGGAAYALIPRGQVQPPGPAAAAAGQSPAAARPAMPPPATAPPPETATAPVQPRPSPVAEARSLIAAGRLGAAAALIERLGGDRGAAGVRSELERAVAAERRRWRERIDAAPPGALAAELAAADLPPALRAELDLLAADRAARPGPAPQATAAWRALASRLDACREGERFASLGEALDAAKGDLPAEDAPLAEALAQVPRLLQQAEGAVRLLLRSGVAAEAAIGGRQRQVKLTGATAGTISWQADDGSGDAGTATRPGFARGAWPAIIDQAAAEAGIEQVAQVKAAFLWFWREPGAGAAIAALGGDPLGQALARIERSARILPIAARAAFADGQIRIAYDLIADGLALADDFHGDGLAHGPEGLRWTTAAPRGERDDPMAGLRWTQELLPPVRIAARIAVQPDSLIACGVAAGGKAVRAAISTRTDPPAKDAFGAILTGADGKAQAIPLSIATPPADRAVELAWTVAADGTVTMSADGADATPPGARLPRGAPVTLVVHSTQRSGTSTVTLSRIDIAGVPP